jgi:hypothetical protein
VKLILSYETSQQLFGGEPFPRKHQSILVFVLSDEAEQRFSCIYCCRDLEDSRHF